MPTDTNRLLNYLPPARKLLVIPGLALKTVTAKRGTGVYASSDTLFRDAIFGRDSLEVAEDLLESRPRLVRNILLKMGELQGVHYNDMNEEEPGAIIHEYRTLKIDGRIINEAGRQILSELAQKWGGNDKELAYYGTVDATPHFLRALRAYCLTYSDTILDATLTQRDGTRLTMREVTTRASSWLMNKLSDSRSGLLEYHHVNPHGILNQVWKDSNEFYVHENRELANHAKPIGSIEVQGLAYDALMAASAFFPSHETMYLQAARKLRDRTIELLWQESRNYFALGTDYDANDKLRIIQTATANPGALLDTGFFDELEASIRTKYIAAIIKRLMDQDFLTDAGVRSRALSHAELIDFWDYHGSFVTWPKETYDIAKGMQRQGFPKLGHQLENRLLNVIVRTSAYPEFVYVDEWGRVLAGPPSRKTHGNFVYVGGHNTPERMQAWTISAAHSIVNRRLGQKFRRSKHQAQEGWQTALESDILTHIPLVKRHSNPLKLAVRYPSYKYKLAVPPQSRSPDD